MYKKIIILSLILTIIYLLFTNNKENFSPMFKDNGKKNKLKCQLYHINLYNNCVKDSGGIDTQGNCKARLMPNLEACTFTDY